MVKPTQKRTYLSRLLGWWSPLGWRENRRRGVIVLHKPYDFRPTSHRLVQRNVH